MGTVATSFYEDVLHRIGAPITDENMRACHAWQMAEGGHASYNPFNTTEPEPGTSNYNNFGPGGSLHVKNYPNQREGVDATVKTLENGHYPSILSSFRRGNDGHSVMTTVDGSVWGTHGAAATYVRIYGVTTPAFRLLVPRAAAPYLQGSDVRLVQEALNRHGYHLTVDAIYGPHSVMAVRDFEHRVKLATDGIVGPHVRAALGLQH